MSLLVFYSDKWISEACSKSIDVGSKFEKDGVAKLPPQVFIAYKLCLSLRSFILFPSNKTISFWNVGEMGFFWVEDMKLNRPDLCSFIDWNDTHCFWENICLLTPSFIHLGMTANIWHKTLHFRRISNRKGVFKRKNKQTKNMLS